MYNPNSSQLIEKARLHAQRSKEKFHSTFPLAGKKLQSLNLDLKDLRRHSAKILSGAVIAGGMLFGSPNVHHSPYPSANVRTVQSNDKAKQLHDALMLVIGKQRTPLTHQEEDDISETIQETLGIKAVAELDGHRLNHSFGRMGGEQHLPRYPGDTIGAHDELQIKGITANRGAFGYFASTKDQLTQEEILKEKYYVAVQTLYLPDWNKNYKDLKEWYKFRKVLVINPTNGKSVVAVVGDAGPAAWTGKQYGGSPEVMAYLQPFANKNNGMVLLFFVDDAQNTVALGPINDASQFIAKR